MSTVAFFGHRNYDYAPLRGKVKETVVDLIENHGATTFLNGFRGTFDDLCADVVFSLKREYPFIRNIMVLSYLPRRGFILPGRFDESVYLLETPVLPKFAIYYTNRAIVERADFLVSGVIAVTGGAFAACDYALRKNKIVLNIFRKTDSAIGKP